MKNRPTALDEVGAANAYQDGRRAGLEGMSPSLAPNEYEQPTEHANWLLGWQRGAAERKAREITEEMTRRRAVTLPCQYQRGMTCDCGGRGMCLDVA